MFFPCCWPCVHLSHTSCGGFSHLACLRGLVGHTSFFLLRLCFPFCLLLYAARQTPCTLSLPLASLHIFWLVQLCRWCCCSFAPVLASSAGVPFASPVDWVFDTFSCLSQICCLPHRPSYLVFVFAGVWVCCSVLQSWLFLSFASHADWGLGFVSLLPMFDLVFLLTVFFFLLLPGGVWSPRCLVQLYLFQGPMSSVWGQ